jgi:hypothetical protein
VATPTPFFTAKRQRIPCLPTLTRYISPIPPPYTFEGGRSPRRRSRATEFSLIGSKVIHGLNIQRKILHFVSLTICFQVSHLESHDQTHLLLKDSNVGRKLMMGNNVLFLTHMGKGPNSAHRFATRCLKILKNQSCDIEKVVKRKTT